jgi:hypothetical protein
MIGLLYVFRQLCCNLLSQLFRSTYELPSSGFFFKGAAFGMYTTGNGKPSLTKAEFAYLVNSHKGGHKWILRTKNDSIIEISEK